MLPILFLLFEETTNVSTSNTAWILPVAVIVGPILTAIFTYFFTRKMSTANVGKIDAETDKTEAETNKTKVDTISLTIDKLLELTNKFKLAQDEYILLKDKFAVVTRDFEDFKLTVQELLFLMEAVLVSEPPNSPLRRQVEKVKTEFLGVVNNG